MDRIKSMLGSIGGTCTTRFGLRRNILPILFILSPFDCRSRGKMDAGEVRENVLRESSRSFASSRLATLGLAEERQLPSRRLLNL